MNKVLGIMILTGYVSYIVFPTRKVYTAFLDAFVVGLSTALFMGIGW